MKMPSLLDVVENVNLAKMKSLHSFNRIIILGNKHIGLATMYAY